MIMLEQERAEPPLSAFPQSSRVGHPSRKGPGPPLRVLFQSPKPDARAGGGRAAATRTLSRNSPGATPEREPTVWKAAECAPTPDKQTGAGAMTASAPARFPVCGR